MKKMRKKLDKMILFFTEDIYTADIKKYNKFNRFLINIFRVISFAITDFFKDDCPIRAASLTYLVMLSFIPALIFGLFVLRIFNVYNNIFSIIFEWMEKNAPFYEPMVRQILNIADNTNLASFGIVGVISTIVSTALILHSIQVALKKIWRVKVKTSISRAIVNYTAMIFLIPILMGVALSLVAYTNVTLRILPPAFSILLSWVMPTISISILILFSYMLTPQTKVNWSNALISSVIIGITIITLCSVYFKMNINVKNYKQIFDNDTYKIEYIIKDIKYNEDSEDNKNIKEIVIERISYQIIESTENVLNAPTYEKSILSTTVLTFNEFSPNVLEQLYKYNFQLEDSVIISNENTLLTSISPEEFSSASAFAQIPVILLLVYIIWIIILFGAELTYALQYYRAYGVDKTNIKLSFAEKELIALELMHIITYRFLNKEKAITIYNLAQELKTAPTIIMEIAESLEKAKYIIKITDSSNTVSYTLACRAELITIGNILYAIRMNGGVRNKNTYHNKYKNIVYSNSPISKRDYETSILYYAKK